ncbi:MAG TPA: hypothetical protein VEW71_00715 [Allosphingosinicella sp.]|nr:hypothetical protein [Allosphingosinicella sp.]
MFKRVLLLIAAAMAGPLAAQAPADPPLDPACPQADLNVPRGPGIVCLGRLEEGFAFSVIYPKSVEQSPALAEALRAEWAAALARMEGAARDRQAERAADAREPHRLSYEAGWRIDADLPEIVAASGTISHYGGGAHGGIEYRVILIDRQRGRAIELPDLFQPGIFEPDLLGYRLWGIRAVQAAFCRALTGQVRARRDDPGAQLRCPPIEDQPVALLCGAGGRIDRMRALLNPYVVGSWAEGPYEVEFPIDAAMMASIKRRLRPAFGLTQETRPRSPARPCR